MTSIENRLGIIKALRERVVPRFEKQFGDEVTDTEIVVLAALRALETDAAAVKALERVHKHFNLMRAQNPEDPIDQSDFPRHLNLADRTLLAEVARVVSDVFSSEESTKQNGPGVVSEAVVSNC